MKCHLYFCLWLSIQCPCMPITTIFCLFVCSTKVALFLQLQHHFSYLPHTTTCNVICSNVCSRLLKQRMSHRPMTQSLGRLERLAWVKLSDRQIDGASPGHNQKTSPVVRHLPLIINVIFKIIIIFIILITTTRFYWRQWLDGDTSCACTATALVTPSLATSPIVARGGWAGSKNRGWPTFYLL